MPWNIVFGTLFSCIARYNAAKYISVSFLYHGENMQPSLVKSLVCLPKFLSCEQLLPM
jgi:hypothetical protein